MRNIRKHILWIGMLCAGWLAVGGIAAAFAEATQAPLFSARTASVAATMQPFAFVSTPEPTPMPTPTPTPEPTPTPTPLPTYADTLTITLHDANAQAMVVPQDASVRFTIKNTSETPVGDIRVCRQDGSIAARVPELRANATGEYTFEETVLPTDAQLDAGRMVYAVVYTLGYRLPGAAAHTRFVGVELTRLPAQPAVEFTRSMPVTTAMPHDTVAIAYRVRNTGNIALTNLVVYDAPVGEVGKLDRLEPGERTAFTTRVEVTSAFVSAPTVTYSHAATEARFECALSPVSVELAQENLQLTLNADRMKVSPGGTATLSFKVSNLGTVAYSHLSLTDQVLGDIATLPADLRPGQQIVFTKVVSIKSTTTFRSTIRGRGESGSGAVVSSNPLTIAVTAAEEDASIRLTAVLLEDSSVPGQARIRVTVRNEGILDLRDIALSEQTRGYLKTLAVVPPGETNVEIAYPAENGDAFQFLAELTDPAGGRLTVLSNTLTASHVAEVSPAQTQTFATLAPGAMGVSYHLIDNPTTFRRMMIGVVVVLGALIAAMLMMSGKRRRLKKRIREKNLRRIRRGIRVTRMEEKRTSQDSRDARAGRSAPAAARGKRKAPPARDKKPVFVRTPGVRRGAGETKRNDA